MELITPLLIIIILGAVASAKESRQGGAANNNREKNIALPKSKALAMMNVPFEEQVFKDLIALNINTGDLNCGVKMKSKTFEHVKDSETELSDYFRPSFHNEFVVK